MYKNYKAETVDQAIALGLEELKVAEEDIKIDVLEGGSKGFLGLGKKDAEVQLTVINPELKTYETIDALINRGQPGEERSEEHTSELQSRGHLVCRLLLEKNNRAGRGGCRGEGLGGV